MGLVAPEGLVPQYRAWCPSLTAFLGRSNLDVRPGVFAGLVGLLRFFLFTYLFVVAGVM